MQPQNAKQTTQSDYQQAVGLMKKMGSKNGFNPIPPPQHQWQMAEGEAPLHRMWSWMCNHTIAWGHRSPFAVDREEKELHLEHAAADLGMDAGNARRAWREGVERGIWRNGNQAEGRRKMYLCGEVKPAKGAEPEGEEEAKEASTGLLPPYILKQIKKLSPDAQARFWAEHELDMKLEKRAIAEVVAATRLLFIEKQDSRYERYRVKKIREVHAAKQGSPEQVEAREARAQTILPTIERFVQTLLPLVQTPAEVCSDGGTNSNRHETGEPTLLSRDSESKPEAPSSSSTLSAPRSHTSSQDHDGKKSVNEQYAPGQPASARSVAPNGQNGTHKTKPKKAGEDEAMQLAKALEVDLDAGRQLLDGARGVDPAISLREVIGLCYAKLDNWRVQIRAGKIDNVPGRLIKSLPAAVTGGLRDSVRERVRRELEKEIEYAGLVIADEIASPEDKARELRRLQSLEEELSALGARAKGANG